jgi:uncharacterized protein YidB (DUF937 family)
MLQTIINSLKSEVGNEIIGKTNLSPDKLDGVMSIIGDVTKKEVTSQMFGGNLSTVMNLFSNQKNNVAADQLQSRISDGVLGNLVKKLGLSENLARTIAQIAIPAIIGMITKKNNQTPDDDPSPLNEIFGQKGGGLGGLLGKFLGKR